MIYMADFIDQPQYGGNKIIMEEEIKYPYIVFKIMESYYCINSKHVSTIVQLPHYDKVPAAPPNVTGMFRYRDQVIQMLDLRKTFGFQSMAGECREFEEMIEARKKDHIHWVNELERTLSIGEPFQLAKDPHKCALGKWYDQFTTENQAVQFHLHKIDEPHRRLHHAAEEAELCQKQCDTCEREQCLNEILRQVKEECMPTILELLDETKKIFQSSVYREMVLLLDGMKWGIVVDEIVGVQELELLEERDPASGIDSSSHILNVLESEEHNNLIFELNVSMLSQQMKEYEKVM